MPCFGISLPPLRAAATVTKVPVGPVRRAGARGQGALPRGLVSSTADRVLGGLSVGAGKEPGGAQQAVSHRLGELRSLPCEGWLLLLPLGHSRSTSPMQI